MALSYNQLLELIPLYCQNYNADFMATRPTFIDLGQRKVARDFKVLGIQEQVEIPLLTGNVVVEKPINWIDTVSLFIRTTTESPINSTPLYLRELSFLQYWGKDRVPARPQIYSNLSMRAFVVRPTTNVNYIVTLTYFLIPTLLGPTVQTNDLTLYFPEPLLYACLLQTAPYLEDDQRIATWTQLYNSYLSAAITEDKMRRQDQVSR